MAIYLPPRLYRTKVLRALKQDPHQELEWLNELSLKHLKNYQIWYAPTYEAPSSPYSQCFN